MESILYSYTFLFLHFFNAHSFRVKFRNIETMPIDLEFYVFLFRTTTFLLMFRDFDTSLFQYPLTPFSHRKHEANLFFS